MTGQEKESINRYLAEWMGECWHEWYKPNPSIWSYVHACKKCGLIEDWSDTGPHFRPNYFDSDGFLEVFRKAKESEGWDDFIYKYGQTIRSKTVDLKVNLINVDLIDPYTFNPAWVEFLKG